MLHECVCMCMCVSQCELHDKYPFILRTLCVLEKAYKKVVPRDSLRLAREVKKRVKAEEII